METGPTAALEMDLPIIAVVDLPLDSSGQYTMRVELDGEPVARASVFVNGPAVALPYGMSSHMVS